MATPQLDLTRPPKAMTGLIGGAMDQNQFANAAQEPVAEFMGQAPLAEAPQDTQLAPPSIGPAEAPLPESSGFGGGQVFTGSQVPMDTMAYENARVNAIFDGAAVEPQAASTRTVTVPETITRPNAPAPEAQPEAPAPETQERVTNVPPTVQRDTAQGAATGAATGAAGTPSAQGAYQVASATGQIQGITPETIEGESYQPVEVPEAERAEVGGYEAGGYEAEKAPEAEGYEARGYTAEGYEALQGVAKTTAENVSQAITRITGQDSPIMQRAVAQATAEANRRGLLNSSMAAGAAQGAILDRAMQIAQADVQNEQFNVAQQNAMESQNIQMGNEALRFTADARNQASAFLANAQNRSAEFLAAERNQNGRFNAEQANRAAEFTANAQNQAAQFAAAAQNQASIFNAGESNRLSMFAAEQANTAARFAAEMNQAASQFNATAFNQAQQRYTDAMNAAVMAQTDAENQSRRDLAVFSQQAEQNRLDRENRLELANISAGASMAAASASAGASMANAAAQREFAAGQAALDREFRSSENAASRQFSREQMGAQAYDRLVQNIGAAMQNPNLTDEGRRNFINTQISLHNGNPYAGVNVDIGGED